MLPSRFLTRLKHVTLPLGILLTAPTSADQLIVDINGIERLGGTMMVAVFDAPAGWEDSENPIALGKDSVLGPKVRLIFSDLEAGAYAVKLYHDENNNGALDTNMLGIPSEGYGFSNNPTGIGEPDFEDAMFSVSGDTTIEITLN